MVVQAVGQREVGDDADLAAVVGQAVVEDGAGVVLGHHRVDAAVHQQAVRGVKGFLTLASTRRGPRNRPALQARPTWRPCRCSSQATSRAMAAGVPAAGHADDGDAAALVLGEQVVDDGLTDRLRRAFGRLQVHQQAGAGIDFDDGAALRLQRLADVLADEVDAGDVQAHGARREPAGEGHLGVQIGRAVDGHIAVALDEHATAMLGHRCPPTGPGA